MSNLIKLILSTGVLVTFSVSIPSYSQEANLKELTHKIESAFNNNKISAINDSFEKDIALEVKQKYTAFRNEFPNAKWTINPSTKLKDDQKAIDIQIIGKKKIDNQTFFLKANQKLAIEIKKEKIVSRKILSESSILTTQKKAIDLRLQIPETALTGSRYDIDIIITKPLENLIIAGTLAPFESNTSVNPLNGGIELKPMGSGGIFKSVLAPLNPGSQKWVGIIAHPDGMVLITKLVRIVSNTNDID